MAANFNDQYVNVNGIRLHCVTAGSGPLILFLHGFPEFWYEWREQLGRVQQRSPGSGTRYARLRPLGQAGRAEQYRWTCWSRMSGPWRIIFPRSESSSSWRHDWGGAVAWAFAIAHPDRLEKLVIINAPHPGIFQPAVGSGPGSAEGQPIHADVSESAGRSNSVRESLCLAGETVLGAGLKSGALSEEDKAAYLRPGHSQAH